MGTSPRMMDLILIGLVVLLTTGALVLRGTPVRSAASTVGDDPVPSGAASVIPPAPSPTAVVARLALTPTATEAPTERVLASAASTVPLVTVRARRGGPEVREGPSDSAPAFSGVYYDTYLPVYARWISPAGALWYQVRLWGVLTGWIRADQTVTGDPPTPTPSTGSSPSLPAPRPGRSAIFPLAAGGVTAEWVNFRSGAGVENARISVLPPGTPFVVRAWQIDSDSSPWYRVAVGGQSGWLWSGAVRLVSPAPSRVVVRGQPIWWPVAGKGMWMPVPLMAMANPHAVVKAAHALGLTHIYLEVGSSGRGFYGRQQVDRLLPVAHQQGIEVIGWVLTSLDDLPSDVSLCRSVARYQTPSGDRLDGIAPDMESNLARNDVAAFAQILRAELGPDSLIVGVIFPVGSWVGYHHPIARILSQSFNVLAPMAYWHEAQQQYASATVADYISHAVSDIQQAVDDPRYPVAVIGQTYDGFSRNGAGPNSPTGAEIEAALAAAQRAGAIGVSLFQWGTTTPSEWKAIRDFRWTTGPRSQ